MISITFKRILSSHIDRRRLRLRAKVTKVATERVAHAKAHRERGLRMPCILWRQIVDPFWSELLFWNPVGSQNFQISDGLHPRSGPRC